MWEWKSYFLWKCYGGDSPWRRGPPGGGDMGAAQDPQKPTALRYSWDAFWPSRMAVLTNEMYEDGSQINTNFHIFLTSILSWVWGLGHSSYTCSAKQITIYYGIIHVESELQDKYRDALSSFSAHHCQCTMNTSLARAYNCNANSSFASCGSRQFSKVCSWSPLL